MENREIARHLDEVADLLAVQAENPFRVAAYRDAEKSLSLRLLKKVQMQGGARCAE